MYEAYVHNKVRENKVPIKTISKLAGISQDTALKYYNQVSDEGMEEAMQSLENDSSKSSLCLVIIGDCRTKKLDLHYQKLVWSSMEWQTRNLRNLLLRKMRFNSSFL